MSFVDPINTPIPVLRGRLGSAIRDRSDEQTVAEHRRHLTEAKLARDVRSALSDPYPPDATTRATIAALLISGVER